MDIAHATRILADHIKSQIKTVIFDGLDNSAIEESYLEKNYDDDEPTQQALHLGAGLQYDE
ncbi:hypothetical protein Tdes44962_MAKER05587 [Teratosphaeria destructans]|uniref:Uncharacterized protein n=1 Tax=Teratosphaeria destructans TaxID=418781 RepID=A0A9W7SJP0_9PEZI|nr:hypothetical protein Tdes44962_MAKER05587 [Teratosphaeria destructans]